MLTDFLVAATITMIWGGIGTTLGYHRLLSHKAAKVNKGLLYLLLLGGYLCLQGSPIGWAKVHRFHHQTTDTDLDPHTPKKGFWHSFVGWIWGRKPDPVILTTDSQIKDLIRNYPLLVMFGTRPVPSGGELNLTLVILWRVLLWYLFGPSAAIGSIVGGVVVFFLPSLVNSLCHIPKFGYRNYDTNDNSCNIPWLSLLTFGESWHNNHHAKPRRLANGERDEFDVTYQVARLFALMGLIKSNDESTNK